MEICYKCGINYGKKIKGRHISKIGKCGICKETAHITNSRHYGVAQNPSNCCKAEVGTGGVTTRFYYCTKCKKPCDIGKYDFQLKDGSKGENEVIYKGF